MASSHPREAVLTPSDPDAITVADAPSLPATQSDPRSAATQYLTALLGATLHLYTSDGRMFAGEFKCTDKDRNIILARAFEYRLPTLDAVQAVAVGQMAAAARAQVEMTSRFMGLIVVPGQYITRIEVEEH